MKLEKHEDFSSVHAFWIPIVFVELDIVDPSRVVVVHVVPHAIEANEIGKGNVDQEHLDENKQIHFVNDCF